MYIHIAHRDRTQGRENEKGKEKEGEGEGDEGEGKREEWEEGRKVGEGEKRIRGPRGEEGRVRSRGKRRVRGAGARKGKYTRGPSDSLGCFVHAGAQDHCSQLSFSTPS